MDLCDSLALSRIEEESRNASSILAVGAGSINALCKLAADRAGKPYAIFATAPSMDGFASASASVYENGFKLTFGALPPRMILADTEVLAAAPAYLKAAGFGDLLGKYTALADWRISHLVTGEYYCENL
jgi:glycerol-1-phosphate dehydrogenase [NAD(P)+]